ncbi:MAG TPA: hypothetical protein VI873_00050 [Candidatus Peribacteraceae bacterium]|nr:hypothetical protein [Candidatus Peribacteraceae bacterium]
MQIASENPQVENEWQQWLHFNDFEYNNGKMVEVQRIEDQKIIIRGEVTRKTDLIGGPAILEYGNYGQDNAGNSVVSALTPPLPPSVLTYTGLSTAQRIARYQAEFLEWSKQYRFRVVG